MTVPDNKRAWPVHHLAPAGEKPAAQLRDALARHLEVIEDNPAEFLALMRGKSSPDPKVRAITDDVRWLTAASLLHAFHAPEPARPALRASMRGWVGYLDEFVMDHLRHHELTRSELVELAATALLSSLEAAHSVDPRVEVDPAAIGLPIG